MGNVATIEGDILHVFVLRIFQLFKVESNQPPSIHGIADANSDISPHLVLIYGHTALIIATKQKNMCLKYSCD